MLIQHTQIMACSASVGATHPEGFDCYESPNSEANSPAATEVNATEHSSVPSILIIDDDELLLYTYKKILGSAYEVVLAKSGEEGLEQLAYQLKNPNENEYFQAIICDMQMPKLDGRGVYSAIQERFPEFLSRVILCTGGTIQGPFADLLAENNAKILQKPCTADEIFGAVASIGD